MKYYHVTDPKNIPSILKDGLLGEPIFVLTNKQVAGQVALSQCGLHDYALFSIDAKGIHGEIENDNVAECTAQFQRMVHQKKISPSYLNMLGCWHVKWNSWF